MLPAPYREYVDPAGRRPFSRWTSDLDDQVLARVFRSIERLASGNVSNVKAVGHGVSELRLNFGPGYRVYFGRDGMTLVVLLGGGTKKRQQQDIADAHARWSDYKVRKQAQG